MMKGWPQVSTAAVIGMLVAVPIAGQHGPASAATQAVAEGTEVPLRVEAGRLLVPVDIGGGVQADFIVSTGNAVTVLSEAFAERHDTSRPFRLGDVEVKLENAARIPHEQLAPDGEMIAGIIGANSLNRYDMLIDAPAGRLVLKPSGRAVSWPGVALSDPVRLRVYHGVVLGLDVEIDGTTYPAMLDTGTSALVMNEGAGGEIGLDNEGTVSLGLGSATMASLPGRVRDLPILDRWDPDGNGFVIVGAPIAWECAISISWMHRELRTCAQ